MCVERNLIDRTGAVPVAGRFDRTLAFHVAHKVCHRFVPT
jgi:hypothetical protein